MVGVDFFTPLMYPLFADFPVIETLPIFIADFDQPGVVSPFGGCPTAFPSSAQMIAEIKEHDRLAVIWDQNAPGDGVLAGHPGALLPVLRRHAGELRVPGLPVQRPARPPASRPSSSRSSDYLDGAENPAVYFGISAADCAEYIQASRGAGVEAQIYIADSCTSDAVKGLPESDGVIFELQGYLLDQPELNSDFVNAELAAREAAIEEFGPQTPLTSYTRQAFSGVVFIYQVANELLADGGDIDDREALREAVHGGRQLPRRRLPARSRASTTRPSTSRCAPTRATYAAWDGSTFTIDEAIPDGVIDVTELMVAVEEAFPRGG